MTGLCAVVEGGCFSDSDEIVHKEIASRGPCEKEQDNQGLSIIFCYSWDWIPLTTAFTKRSRIFWS